MSRSSLALGVLVGFLSGCHSADAPRARNAADSLGVKVTESVGGLRAWNSLPSLQFEWAVIRDSVEVTRSYHVWDKAGDRYRVEWPADSVSVLVATFRPARFREDAPEGEVALEGRVLTGAERTARLVEGYRRYVNDSYWLLAPLKTMDPGVRRELAPDSGEAVLALSFEDVGMTPGDRYWIRTDPMSGAMTGWTYVLQDSPTPARWTWTDPTDVVTPEGVLRLPTLKVKEGEDVVILTEPEATDALDESLFTDLQPRFSTRRGS